MKSKSIFTIFTVLVVLAGLFGTARPVAANTPPPADALGADLTVAVIWEKEYDWGLAKIASPAALELFTGQSGTSQFTITATRWLAYQDSHLYVQMDVANGAAVAANNVVAQLSAVHNPSGPTQTATINFGSIPAGGSVYRYVDIPFDPALLTPGDTFSVTAVVTSDNVTGGILSASATTPGPRVANESLVVSDNGTPHTFTGGGTWIYDKTFTCGEDQQYTNTVSGTVLLYGIPKPRSASATVTVDCTVPCETGCSLTPGYWKTHSSYGPAPYDDTWAQIGENTAFYLSGNSWYGVLWTAPKGNAYYILAHAYIAARLNQYNGADVSVISANLAAAENFFQTHTPTASLSKAQRAEVLAWATAIDNYNNGLIGPGHCSE